MTGPDLPPDPDLEGAVEEVFTLGSDRDYPADPEAEIEVWWARPITGWGPEGPPITPPDDEGEGP
jgi:hypothetical protein